MYRFSVQISQNKARLGFPVSLLYVYQAWPAQPADARTVDRLLRTRPPQADEFPPVIEISLASNLAPSADRWREYGWTITAVIDDYTDIRGFHYRTPEPVVEHHLRQSEIIAILEHRMLSDRPYSMEQLIHDIRALTPQRLDIGMRAKPAGNWLSDHDLPSRH